MNLKNISIVLGIVLLMGCSNTNGKKKIRGVEYNLVETNNRAVKVNTPKNRQRVALVIGNSNYQGVLPKLNNPINDAKAIKKILEERGFKVIYREDTTKEELRKVLKIFYSRLKRGVIGLLYFSGHGIEVDNKNYLIPINANLKEKEDAEDESISLNRILNRIQKRDNSLNIVILDACRNDPFSKAVGVGGLANIVAPKGLFVAYSTGAGRVSSDGKVGKNGLYTKYLIENMKQPLGLYELFKKTKDEVFYDSNWKQNPSIYDESMGTFYFTPPKGDKIVKYQSNFREKAPYSSLQSKGFIINIGENLKNSVSVTPKVENKLDSIITIQNYQNQKVTVYYRFKWFDKDGIEVGEGMSAWIPTFIDPNDSKTIKGSPPVPNAVNGKFYIK